MAMLLRVVLARVSDLAALDPAAATALRPTGMRPSTPVWYVRGLAADGAAISWAVVEPRTGRVLARDDAG
jgi:D-alanyl-D-alanine carboxypeptidase